ncbi:MAG: class I tRNA ligase family protein [bacterium]|nr:class I tRNA ligase family protein [bacterium]
MDEKKEKTESVAAKREEETLKFWRENKIFEKSLEKNKGKKEFVFYDGPPFATGLPHYGHILAGTIKDVIPRYKTMRGFYVPRKWGWDCHGLPIENLVEKELELKTKKDILSYGIDKFNKKAAESVMAYAADWRRIIPRMGRFVDMDSDYRTLDTSYTESVWWAFKTLYEKKLIYEGFKSMHLCPRCETTLSNFEVSQGYTEITDISIYVKFPVKDAKKPKLQTLKSKPLYMLAWTTTPWTLPGNVALAINPQTTYCKIENLKSKVEGEKHRVAETDRGVYILAKESLAGVLKDYEYSFLEEFAGEKLIGLEYEPPFDYYKKDQNLKNRENGWKVYGGDFVTTEAGTGIVHIAPAFGSDDYELSKKEDLPFIQHVDETGRFKKEVLDFAGVAVKPKPSKEEPNAHQKTDVEIIKSLASQGLLFAKEKITHQYPFCWRCDTPLLNFAAYSWFVKVSKLREKLVEENDKVEWVPPEIGEYRFGNWLKDAKDWAISRSRFWGAAIPVWKCDECKKIRVVGSVEELKSSLKPKNRIFMMRHGQAENNVKNILSGDRNLAALTDIGRKQAVESARKLKKEKINIVFSSDFLRTKQTAEILKKELGISDEKVVFDERLREVNSGIFNGKTTSQYHSYFSSILEKFTKRPPEGENLQDIKNRVGNFLYEIDRKYEGQNILIVSHEYPLWMLDAVSEGWNNKEAVAAKEQKDEYVETGDFTRLGFVPIPHNENYELDLHRPFIDDVKLVCKCDGSGAGMKRVTEVFDCWFESGSMPYAEKHYLGEALPDFNPDDSLFKKPLGYPADFIAEGMDQTRGWFYSMLVLGTALFGRSPYKRVVVNGQILAKDGKKMSKRLKNYPDPIEVIERYGADSLRLYLLTSPVTRGQDMNFLEEGVDEITKKVFQRLDNVLAFYKLYSPLLQPADSKPQTENILNIWILNKLNQLNEAVTKNLESYELDRASRPVEKFIDDLSVWYLRRSRGRIKEGNQEALLTLRFVLLNLSKIIAPFAPFFAEYLYRELYSDIQVGADDENKKESIHLENWPEAGEIDNEVLSGMLFVRSVASMALMSRVKNEVKVRQPLQTLSIKHSGKPPKYWDELSEILKEEINVKEVVLDDKMGKADPEVKLDFHITSELKEEGQARELVRAIQELRKSKGLNPGEKAILTIKTDNAGKDLIEKNKEKIQKLTGLSDVEFSDISGEEVKIDTLNFVFAIRE